MLNLILYVYYKIQINMEVFINALEELVDKVGKSESKKLAHK